MQRIVIPMFKQVYGRDYDDTDKGDRILIQKNTYILEWMGLDMGSYCFLWGKYGPYSLDLKGIIRYELEETGDEQLCLSSFAKNIVISVQDILKEGEDLMHEVWKWMELVCSVHFLKQYMVKDDMELINTLKEYKPYLNNDKANKKAIEIVNGLIR